jgi:cytochrome c oxidase subunit 2
MIYFAFRYKRKSDSDKTAYLPHNAKLEFLWSFIPFVIFLVVFGWGWWVYTKMRYSPKGALEISVIGQKWYWDFVYKSGKKVSKEFYVPVNTPVKLIATSRDVIHSMFLPAFRTKQDVVPGRYTSLWFEAKKEGSYNFFCTEYCGDQHSGMLAKMHVISKSKYEEWLQNNPYKGLSPSQIGAQVFTNKCSACHNVTAEKKVGPGFKGLFGSDKEFMKAAATTADENYIRESILNPNAKIVKGYPEGVMPTFAGQISEEEISGLIEYIKSVK